ncbi:hypothetical protein [Pseudomonas mucidolens]|uniref:HEPN domain-containing protein n=1 Tax=Pseudomonas mucidolens TaxID=46679 RepID=A0A1H2LXP3_9PSED|nr:hypothetical protein [Pseudomonas mucidolens]SDU85478.1 hypothetical protein SAMN05216202_0622 [Pseudomonas mucidolens]
MPKIPLPSFEIIQIAQNYLDAALVLEQSRSGPGALGPASMLAAFSMELFLKAFHARDASIPLQGFGSVEMFCGALKSAHGHDLLKLYDSLPAEFLKAINDASEELSPGFGLREKIERYKNHFVGIRYEYEPGAIGIIRSEMFDVAEHLGKICEALAPRAYGLER